MRVAPEESNRYGIVEPDATLPASDQGRTVPLRGTGLGCTAGRWAGWWG